MLTSSTNALLSKTPARKKGQGTSDGKAGSTDNGRRRRRRLFRRKTVDEFLSYPTESINGQGEAGWVEEDQAEVQESDTDNGLTVSKDRPVPKTSFSLETSDTALIKELEGIHVGEKRHTEQLNELIKAGPIIMNNVGKNTSASFLERTNGVNMSQMQVLLALEEACSLRSPKISKLVDKLRLKKAIPDNCPEKMRLILAEEELFTISNNLNEFATKLVVRKEPIKTSLVVELKSSSTGERKLRTLFLFDDLLVSAHQRVIVFRKHFTEADGDKPADASEILLDSETMSTFSEKSDPVSLQMRTRSISRYEVKWFLPLDQLDSLRTDGLAFDDEALRERLICIENLKSKIKDVRAELEEERRNADKEQAELVLQAPRLPLFLNSTDGRTFCLLMTSERERMEWKKLITQAKQSKDPNKVLEKQPVSKKMSTLKSLTSQLPSFRQSPKPKDPVTRFTNSEVTSLVNHCKTPMVDTHAMAAQSRPEEGTVIASASSTTYPKGVKTHGAAIATKSNSLGRQLRSMGVLTTTANVQTPAPDQIENKTSPAILPSTTGPVYRRRMITKGEAPPYSSSSMMTEDLHPQPGPLPRKFESLSNPVLTLMFPPINTVRRGTLLTSDDKIFFDFETSEQYNHGFRDRLFFLFMSGNAHLRFYYHYIYI
ncbi:unnamed protein product [Schistocephalus solidus]|uniref:PH domain-containing protein n=1 Tax=Schistocephalus solidus TaxID=70667 RepID=A0A183SIJ3_SCHSO|nr:unnamed protein product [Schistocephalus solidus]